MSKLKKIVFAVVGGFVLLMVIAGLTSNDKKAAAPATVTVVETVETVEMLEETPAEDVPVVDEAPAEYAGQENARQSAESYLAMSAFSRASLIKQLEYEGYTAEDATYAVYAVSPDWNEQAARSAKAYLDTTSFSRTGLIEQLEYEGFTAQQAAYGVSQTGL